MIRTRLHLCFGFIILFTSFTIYQFAPTITALAVFDSQSPTIPKELRVTNKTYRSISLTWGASKDNVKVKGYQLFRDGKKVVTISKTNYTNTNLIPGRKYTYTIKAYDSAGNLSVNSAPISVTTIVDNELPSTPSSLTASTATFTTISLKWGASSDNTGIKSYEIYCDYKKVASTSSTFYVCKRLTPGITYIFTVRSCDIAGNYSVQSNIISFSTIADLEAPSIPTGLNANLISETEVSLVWLPCSDNVKVRGYEVYRDGVKTGTSSKTYFTCKKLIPGRNYSFTVKALDGIGNTSVNSNSLKVSTLKDLQMPTIPSNLSIKSTTGSSVSLEWSSSTDNIKLKGYKIYCNTLEVASTTTTHYTVKCPKGIGIYVFWVRSFDLVDNLSGSSNSVTVVKA